MVTSLCQNDPGRSCPCHVLRCAWNQGAQRNTWHRFYSSHVVTATAAFTVSGNVKRAIRTAVLTVDAVAIHMEPYTRLSDIEAEC